MKTVLVFIVALFAVARASYDDDHYFEKEFHDCAVKLGIHDEDVGGMLDKHDHSLGCVHACVLEKYDAFEGADHLNVDKLKKLAKKIHAGDPKLPAILRDVEKCVHTANEEGHGRCETAAILVECAAEEMKDN